MRTLGDTRCDVSPKEFGWQQSTTPTLKIREPSEGLPVQEFTFYEGVVGRLPKIDSVN
jgi:hypothetical protein